jgi:hypothetical protein
MNERPTHGSFIRLKDLESLNKAGLSPRLKALREVIPRRALTMNLNEYDYFFKDLVADPDNLLANDPKVVQALKDLGAAMMEGADTQGDFSGIPSAYTYFGQFIDHDLTLAAASNEIVDADLNENDLKPIPPDKLSSMLKNIRTGTFDLDSVYNEGRVPRESGFLKIGEVSPYGAPKIPGKGVANDLPRKAGSIKADIGDPRNDENTIIAQLHVAMLKFHNAVMQQGNSTFEETQESVRKHYQWIVLYDFLPRICAPGIVEQILNDGSKFYHPTDKNLFIPVEFSAAAYRFGHSMVRKTYNFNWGHEDTSLAQLFRFAGEKGDLGGMEALPRDWIIQWDRFLPFGENIYNRAKKIDTRLSYFLHNLRNTGVFQVLAQTNLLRGYLLSLPTGQAAARKVLGEAGVLSGDEILRNASDDERKALLSANLHTRTPLWYYILAEASIQSNGMHLGKLGSTIVAETIIGLIRHTPASILSQANWTPIPGNGFNLEQLISFVNLAPGQSEI